MKKVIFFAVAMMACTFAQAQTEGKVRVGLDMGAALPGDGGGFLFNLEGGYNLADNMRVGLRFGSAAFVKGVVLDSGDELESASVSANGSYIATFDYYLNNGGSFAPFAGAGVGIYNVASVGVSGGDTAEDFEGTVDAGAKFGGFVRGGFELGKFRMGLEYNFVPGSPLINSAGNEVGTMNNGYLGITLGFFVGGGWWGK